MMDNSDKNMPDLSVNDDETSGYLADGEQSSQLDFGGLFSSQFSNIKPLYSSPTGPTEIYAATRYGRRYILKGLKRQYFDDPIYNMALAKEFEIGILLDHPNIRRTLSFEAVDGLGKVIVLEYIDGNSLESFTAANDLTVAQGRDIAGQLADALSYIHSKQIFHRDIKPTNILVSHQGNVVKLIDFNLSDSDEFIILKNPAGSRKYMAPEQLSRSAKPSPSADIYSFGVVINELASQTCDELLAHAAAKCMNKNPDRRPSTVANIRLPLPKATFGQSFSGFWSSRLLTYALLAICILLASLIIFFLFNR